MKANEFVKNIGLKKVKYILENAPEWAYETAGPKDYANKEWSINCPMKDYVLISDLKRLVESHELVERYGTADEAKEYLPMLRMDSYDELKQAIADVESCMEVASESN